MMPLDIDVIAKIVSPILVAIVGAIAKAYFEARPKLISYLVHASSLPLPESENGPDRVHTHGIVIRNTGKKAAHNIRIGHITLPPSYQIYPPVSHTVVKGQGDSAEIVIPVLVQNEQVSISYLYLPPLLWNQVAAYTKCDEGMAKEISVIPSAPLSKQMTIFLWSLLFIGASTCIYWLFILLANWALLGP